MHTGRHLSRLLLTLASASLVACGSLPTGSHRYDPLGWPAKGLQGLGFLAADSGIPLLRETGRLLQATGELADAPALLVEGLLTADGRRLLGAGEHLVAGTGATVTATWNLPFFVMPGANIDLGRDVGLVNDALAYLESLPAARWRFGPNDPRRHVFPPGTRARASGGNLVFTVPGHGEVLQAAEGNAAWSGLQWLAGTNFPAQERSWGFVVRSRSHWRRLGPRQRAVTILHEFYHQHMQMRDWLLGWTVVYWPAYLATFPFTGWHGHWAEMGSFHDAGAVDRALRTWVHRPPPAGGDRQR